MNANGMSMFIIRLVQAMIQIIRPTGWNVENLRKLNAVAGKVLSQKWVIYRRFSCRYRVDLS